MFVLHVCSFDWMRLKGVIRKTSEHRLSDTSLFRRAFSNLISTCISESSFSHLVCISEYFRVFVVTRSDWLYLTWATQIHEKRFFSKLCYSFWLSVERCSVSALAFSLACFISFEANPISIRICFPCLSPKCNGASLGHLNEIKEAMTVLQRSQRHIWSTMTVPGHGFNVFRIFIDHGFVPKISLFQWIAFKTYSNILFAFFGLLDVFALV